MIFAKNMIFRWKCLNNKKAPFGAFFSLGINACEATVTISLRYTCKIYLLCLGFPALLSFCAWRAACAGRAIPTHFRPTRQSTKNCDAKCDANNYSSFIGTA